MKDTKSKQKASKQPPDPNTWDEHAVRRMARGWWGHPVSTDSDSDDEQGASAGARFHAPPMLGAVMQAFGGPRPGARMLRAKAAVGGGRPPMAMAAPPPMPLCAPACAAAPGGAIGLKAGGAQDVSNFRENIKANKLPLPQDVTFEGLVSSYFFDTSSPDAPPCTDLFCPAYSLALAPDPLLAPVLPSAAGAAGAEAEPMDADSSDFVLVDREEDADGSAAQQSQHGRHQAKQGQDVFLAVGLDSGITDFKRPKLNLCILLDVSGSMDSGFDRYYYDPASGQRQELSSADAAKTKLDVAKSVIKGLLGLLQQDDSVAISLFSDSAASPKRMGAVSTADLAGIGSGVDALKTVGGTNFSAGLDEAASQLRGYRPCIDADPATTENRIVVLTDAETNSGDISEAGLGSRLKALAADSIHCTIVGVGLDFNTRLIEAITKTKGCNYFSVHSPGDFKRVLEDDFDYWTSPLVFDLELRSHPSSLAPPAASDATAAGNGTAGDGGSDVSAPAAAPAAGREASDSAAAGASWRVLHVYGSPETEERRLSGSDSIIRIHSLFPSAKSDEGIKGGVVLLRVAPPPGLDVASAPPLRLSVRYADRSGTKHESLRAVEVPSEAMAAVHGGDSRMAYYQSSGVRKAVCCARLADALQCWLTDAWSQGTSSSHTSDSWQAGAVAQVGGAPPPSPALPAATPYGEAPRLRPGCPLLPPGGLLCGGREPLVTRALGRWERASRPLVVGPEAAAAFRQLLPWLEAEVAELGDDEMHQEAELVRRLIAVAGG